MSGRGHELPMASVGCALPEADLSEQLERYRRLGLSVSRLALHEDGLRAWFEAGVDLVLLEETLAVERGCCSFFALDYDAPERCLSITADSSARSELLELIASALAGSEESSAAR